MSSSSSSEPQSFQVKLEGPAEFFNNFYLIKRSSEVEKSGFKFQLICYLDKDSLRTPDSEKQTEGIILRCHRAPSDDRISGWTLRAAVLKGSEFVPFEFTRDITEVALGTSYEEQRNKICQVRIEEIQIEDPFDWSKPSDNIHTDVCLVAEGREFYSCKATLATFCDLFRGMFLLNFKEAKMDRVDVTVITADELQELLDVIFHKGKLDEHNVLSILELNDVVGMPKIKARCLRVLAQLKDSEVPLSSRIVLADRFFSLTDLLEATLEPLTTPAEVQRALPEDLQSLNPKTVLRLLKKMNDTVKLPSERFMACDHRPNYANHYQEYPPYTEYDRQRVRDYGRRYRAQIRHPEPF